MRARQFRIPPRDFTKAYLDGCLGQFFSEGLPCPEHLLAVARRAGERQIRHRAAVSRALVRFQREIGADGLAERAAAQLAEDGTVAVVTGQQAGLFTGPLYTVYKALTAVALADWLSGEGYRAVPVFWVASEDDDWSEMSACHVPGEGGENVSLRAEAPERAMPSGMLPALLAAPAVDGLIQHLRGARYLSQVQATVHRAYSDGTLAFAFARMMADLTRETGLVMLDPMLEELRAESLPVFRALLCQAKAVSDALSKTSALLSARGYVPGVHKKENAVLAFLMTDDGRQSLEHYDGQVVSSGGYRALAVHLVAEAERSPGLLGTNALSRPLVQDYLLPTAVYVSGPSELRYLAQLGGIYELLGLQRGVIYPRCSVTLVEPALARYMEKYGVLDSDIPYGIKEAFTRFIRSGRALSVTERLCALRQTLRATYEDLGPLMAELGLSDLHLRNMERIASEIDWFETRVIRAFAELEKRAKTHFERLQNSLFPDGCLQERKLNITYFLAKYGPDIIQEMKVLLRLGKPGEHMIIDL